MKPYKIALLTGTHQHRWPDDGSGVCEKCHKEHFPHVYKMTNPGICSICGAVGKCPHDSCYSFSEVYHICRKCHSKLEHTKILVAEDMVCWECSVCGWTQSPHTFADGICSVCGWECPHNDLTNLKEDGHKCNKCGMIFSHTISVVGTPEICRQCEACGYVIGHEVSGLGQTCAACGLVHNAHSWSNGTCIVCGVQCRHPEIDSRGYCTTCNKLVYQPGGLYIYGTSGGYDGSYMMDRSEDGYYVYKGSIWSNGSWVSNGFNLFSFRVFENPMQFGGEFAYKLTGYVFTKSNSVNVSPSLLTADGVCYLKLAQYNLDGTLREASMDGYTSADCVSKTCNFAIYSFTP